MVQQKRIIVKWVFICTAILTVTAAAELIFPRLALSDDCSEEDQKTIEYLSGQRNSGWGINKKYDCILLHQAWGPRGLENAARYSPPERTRTPEERKACLEKLKIEHPERYNKINLECENKIYSLKWEEEGPSREAIKAKKQKMRQAESAHEGPPNMRRVLIRRSDYHLCGSGV